MAWPTKTSLCSSVSTTVADWKVVATWEPRSGPVEGGQLMTLLHGFEGTEQVI
jgi:hypothetical protein